MRVQVSLLVCVIIIVTSLYQCVSVIFVVRRLPLRQYAVLFILRRRRSRSDSVQDCTLPAVTLD